MFILAKQNTYTATIKKSRFDATAIPADSAERALTLLEELKDPKATHNCWAYKIGDDFRSSDDGEPGGTAGRPILAAIEAQKVDRCLVLVTRYFGGIKLGAGGLVRAYGGTAAECLRTASKRAMELRVTVVVRAPFAAIGEVYPLLERFAAMKKNESYEEAGMCLEIDIPKAEIERFRDALADATRGAALVDI